MTTCPKNWRREGRWTPCGRILVTQLEKQAGRCTQHLAWYQQLKHERRRDQRA